MNKKRDNEKKVAPAKKTTRKAPSVKKDVQETIADYEQRLEVLKARHDQYKEAVKTFTMLLSSFGVLTRDKDVEITTPKKGTPYFYLFKSMTTRDNMLYIVKTCNWIGGSSDLFRFSDGNMFLDEHTANAVCHAKNMMLLEIQEIQKRKKQ